MEKRGWVTLTAVVVTGVVAVAAVTSVRSVAHADASDAAATAAHTITVTSTASVGTAPDEAVIGLGVTSQGADAPSALDANAQTTKAVVDALLAEGLTKADLETTNVGLNQRTFNRGTPQESTAYVASTQIEVTVHDLGTVGTVIQDAVHAGANSLHGVRFDVSGQAAARDRALSEAVKTARTKADTMAQAAGTQVTGVIEIHEQAAVTRPYYANQALRTYATDAVPAPQVIAPKTLPTKVTVVVTWSLA
jgi:uncharacterized protein